MKISLLAVKLVLKYLYFIDRKKYKEPKALPHIDYRLNLHYKEDKQRAHAFDIYTPKKLKSKTTIVDVHGGSYIYGFKELNRDYLMYFVNKGFKVLNINYSLSGVSKIDQEHQILEVVDFLYYLDDHYKEFNIDPDNVCLMADSAGAHLALMAYYIVSFSEIAKLFHKETVKNIKITSLVLSSPVYNFEDVYDWFKKGATKKLINFIGGGHYEDKDYIAKINPLRYIKEYSLPRTFVTTSEKDFLLFTVLHLGEDLKKYDIPHRFYYLNSYKKDIGHIFNVISYKEDYAIKCNDAIIDFLNNKIVNDDIKVYK